MLLVNPPEDQSLATNGIEEGSKPFSGPFTDGLGHIGFCGPDMTIDTFSPVSQDKSPTPIGAREKFSLGSTTVMC